MDGTCEDALEHLNVAYLKALTNDPNFVFTHDTSGCNKFCQSLPDYSNQIAMLTEGQAVDACVCFYQYGKLPSVGMTPEYVIRSPPKFSLINPSSSVYLGISSYHDCAANEIDVIAQADGAANSTRSQFLLSYGNRLVSAACPEKVLTANCNTGLMVLKDPTFPSEPQQEWKLNDDGRIANSYCPSLSVAAIQESAQTLDSFYFSLANPTTSMVMGVAEEDCTDGSVVTLQKAVPGSPAQQFYSRDDIPGAIISLKCPNMALSVTQTLPGVRKIKIQSAGIHPVMLAEVEVYGESNVNQALGKPSTQSTTYSGHNASLAVDGVYQTYSNTFSNTFQGAGKSQNGSLAVRFQFFIICNCSWS